ncbi:hypothetical protein LWI29_019391 [Acer saccharum]|uniref:Retrovirus-related Pol polyprotein from transposon TNT 1-94-like beta-barrel domain-containing protein n=1 Tax=Acer saccharum TaxID=4024 RepID=A0AA39VCG8_ACESA|nr:hypothetical protein LWI29_019391 [Acer saccharum]
MGKGKISISLKDGSKNTISEVLFVPSLQQNMLSEGQLSEKGYDMRIYRGVCTINDEQKGLIAKLSHRIIHSFCGKTIHSEQDMAVVDVAGVDAPPSSSLHFRRRRLRCRSTLPPILDPS